MILFLACLAAAASLAEYRLKFAATVEVIENGVVVGKKTLKPGTLLVEATASKPLPEPGTTETPVDAASSRLPPGMISPIRLKVDATGKPTVIRARIQMYDELPVLFSAAEKSKHWSVQVCGYADDWSPSSMQIMTAIVAKDSPIGKRVEKVLSDGKDHYAHVKVATTPRYPDFLELHDFELINKPTVP